LYYILLCSDRLTTSFALAEDWSTFRARQVILQAINNGDIKAAQWWLERKAKFEFAPSKAA